MSTMMGFGMASALGQAASASAVPQPNAAGPQRGDLNGRHVSYWPLYVLYAGAAVSLGGVIVGLAISNYVMAAGFGVGIITNLVGAYTTRGAITAEWIEDTVQVSGSQVRQMGELRNRIEETIDFVEGETGRLKEAAKLRKADNMREQAMVKQYEQATSQVKGQLDAIDKRLNTVVEKYRGFEEPVKKATRAARIVVDAAYEQLNAVRQTLDAAGEIREKKLQEFIDTVKILGEHITKQVELVAKLEKQLELAQNINSKRNALITRQERTNKELLAAEQLREQNNITARHLLDRVQKLINKKVAASRKRQITPYGDFSTPTVVEYPPRVKGHDPLFKLEQLLAQAS